MQRGETERLLALRRYGILDTLAEGAFDRITSLAARLLDVPIAIAGLVDTDRIWFKSHHGIAVEQVDRIPGLCATAIEGRGLYVVTDARTDPRAAANPLVTAAPWVRFYAAAPLRTADGFNLGTLCVIDHEPRHVDWHRLSILETLAQVIVDQMELRLAARRVDALSSELMAVNAQLRIQATHDELTGLWNRRRILEHLHHHLSLARRHRQSVAVLLVDVDRFKDVNDRHGHLVGDRVLHEVARRLDALCRAGEAVGRFGGEEFLVVLFGCTPEQTATAAERMRRSVSDGPILVDGGATTVHLSISGGLAVGSGDADPQALLRAADAALYAAKAGGRDRIEAAA